MDSQEDSLWKMATPEELEQIKLYTQKQDRLEKIFFEKAVAMLSLRDHSVGELRAKLRKRGASESICERVLQRLNSCGYLDDERFARNFMESGMRRGWGWSRIELGLKQKVLDPSIVSRMHDYYQDNVGQEGEEVRIRMCALKRRQEGKTLVSTFGFLRRRGFSASLLRRVLVSVYSDEDLP